MTVEDTKKSAKDAPERQDSDRVFFDLCYDQYKAEMNEADVLFQRVGVLLIVLPVLAGGLFTLGRIDLLGRCFERVDICLYYAASLTGWLALFVSVVFLMLAMMLRRYEVVATMPKWHAWRDKYREYRASKKDDMTSVDAKMVSEMCEPLAHAQETNAQVNQKRRKLFQKAICAAAIATLSVFATALFFFVLRVQGV